MVIRTTNENERAYQTSIVVYSAGNRIDEQRRKHWYVHCTLNSCPIRSIPSLFSIHRKWESSKFWVRIEWNNDLQLWNNSGARCSDPRSLTLNTRSSHASIYVSINVCIKHECEYTGWMHVWCVICSAQYLLSLRLPSYTLYVVRNIFICLAYECWIWLCRCRHWVHSRLFDMRTKSHAKLARR